MAADLLEFLAEGTAAELLRDAEHDPAGERPPEAADPADDHRLKGREQPRWSQIGIETARDPEHDPRDGDHHHGHPHGQGKDVAAVDPHQLCDLRVIGHRPEIATQRGAEEQVLQPADHGQRGPDRDQRQHRYLPVADVDPGGGQRA